MPTPHALFASHAAGPGLNAAALPRPSAADAKRVRLVAAFVAHFAAQGHAPQAARLEAVRFVLTKSDAEVLASRFVD